jgi:hypothetical protein
LALILGAGVLIAEGQRQSPEDATEAQSPGKKPLYGFSEEDVAALTVTRQGETLEFQRDEGDTWQMVKPETAPAEPAAIAFLLSRILTDTPAQELTITPNQQTDFGFDRPTGQVQITLKDGTVHQVVLGADDFSGSSLYVLKDPETVPLPEDTGETTVYVVSKDLANGVDRPLAEWQATSDETSQSEESAPAEGAGDQETGTAPSPEAGEIPTPEGDPASPETDSGTDAGAAAPANVPSGAETGSEEGANTP